MAGKKNILTKVQIIKDAKTLSQRIDAEVLENPAQPLVHDEGSYFILKINVSTLTKMVWQKTN